MNMTTFAPLLWVLLLSLVGSSAPVSGASSPGAPAVSTSAAAAATSPAAAPPAPTMATDFSLKDLNGKTHKLSSMKGKVVVLSFWATWCGPCRIELPRLEQLSQELVGQNLLIYGVNADSEDMLEKVKPLVSKLGLSFPILLDTDNAAVNRYNLDGIIPYTVIIDPRGAIRHIHSGYTPGDERLVQQEVKDLLKEFAPPAAASPRAP